MPHWKIFGPFPYKEALHAGLQPGDGIAVRLYKSNGEKPVRRAEILTLTHMDSSGFTASDHHGTFVAYRWEQAVAWEKR